jgi:Icc-related predicted phosphoesterase
MGRGKSKAPSVVRARGIRPEVKLRLAVAAGARCQFPSCNKFLFEHPITLNHDWLFQKDPAMAKSILSPSITYLQDSSVQIRDLKIYGSPWQPEFLNWAFNLPRGPQLREKWRRIPKDTDILITHGPPAGILDETPDGENVGCEELHEALARIKPKLHIFGHVHHGYGTLEVAGTKFVNASICDEAYLPSHSAIVVDL